MNENRTETEPTPDAPPLYMVRLANGGVEVYERCTLNYVGQWPLSEQYIVEAVCERLNHRLSQAREEGRKTGIEQAAQVCELTEDTGQTTPCPQYEDYNERSAWCAGYIAAQRDNASAIRALMEVQE